MARVESDAGQHARAILAGRDAAPDDVLRLVKKELKRERKFGLARKLLDRYASDPRHSFRCVVSLA